MAVDAKNRWHKQESRSVRPFRSADEYLKEVGLRLYADEEFSGADVIQTASIDLARMSLAVRVPKTPLNFDEIVGLSASALRLVVTVEDRMFKDTVVTENIPVSELNGSVRIVDIDCERMATLSWAGEMRVHVAIVLAEQQKGEVGTAQRTGSWVARKTFSIGRPRDTASFSIDAVEPDYFETRGLPKTTTYLVEINDSDLNQSCENLPDLVKVSLAKDVHAALAKDEDSPMAKAIIKSIYVDVVTTILATGYGNLDKREQVKQDSILDVVTAKLAKSTGLSADKLRTLAAETAGAQLRAVVQADVELSRALVSAAQRR